MFKHSEIKNFFINALRLFTFVFCLITFDLFSQPGTWVAVYGGTKYDRGSSIAQTFDKGYIVCGSTSSYGMGNTDIYLLKLDSAGKFQWQNTFGGTGIENSYCIKQTSDSGFIICGYTNSFGNGGYDAYLVKTDSLGKFQWQKTYGGSNWDFAYWAEQTSDGGYILSGETYSSENDHRAYLIKTDSNGDTAWTKTYGGMKATDAREVHQTTDDGYVFAGSIQTNPGNKDFYWVKTNSNGDTLWTKTHGNNNNDSCNSITLCQDGGFLLGGGTEVMGKKKDYFIKTNSFGNVLQEIADTLSAGTISRIREGVDGQYVMLVNAGKSGAIGQEILFYGWNPFVQWWSSISSSFGGSQDEQGYDFIQTADSGFVLVGYTETFGIGPDNIFIAKTNKVGQYNNTVNSYVSVNEISENNEKTLIYPNPFSQEMFLQIDRDYFNDEKNFLFEISDISGRSILKIDETISHSSSEPIRLEIPIEKFTAGFYIASLQSGSKKIHRKLLFVR